MGGERGWPGAKGRLARRPKRVVLALGGRSGEAEGACGRERRGEIHRKARLGEKEGRGRTPQKEDKLNSIFNLTFRGRVGETSGPTFSRNGRDRSPGKRLILRKGKPAFKV